MTSPGSLKPFRFGVLVHQWGEPKDWTASVRQIEAMGYSTALIPDHVSNQFGPITAVQAAADATSTLRVGTFVLDNDFRHPAVVAREAATLDVFSGGRFELGLGAGALQADYLQLGVPFEAGSVRIRRLAEALQIIKALFAGGPVTFSGEFYQVSNLSGAPRPAQQPHPPIVVGGGGKRMLSVAAHEADIVSLNVKTGAGGPDWTDATDEATARKLTWIREAAGERFSELEINVMNHQVIVTNDRSAAISQLVERYKLPEAEILNSPHCLIGTVEQMCNDLQQRRARFGISYVVVPQIFMNALAPVVERLSGT